MAIQWSGIQGRILDCIGKAVLRLLDLYSRLFFFHALRANFSWDKLDSGELGWCNQFSHIRMDPWQTAQPTRRKRNEQIMDRLGTLLHESIHAILEQFACRSCQTYDTNVGNAGGHGRAFMIIATAMEEACERLLGQRINLRKEHDWLSNWKKLESLPSVHDTSDWKFREHSDEEVEDDTDGGSDYEDLSDGTDDEDLDA